MSSKNKIGEFTFGLIFDDITDGYEQDIWLGVMNMAAELGVNITCYSCGDVDLKRDYLSGPNILYEILNTEQLDGIILLTAAISNESGPEDLEKFIKRYSNIPILSIGQRLDGIPSILIDNKSGMFNVVSHLIKTHNKERIAFIGGPATNPEAIERLEAYKEALEVAGLPFDPELVCPGDFSSEAGENGVKLLLDERKVEFDALIGADDYTAFGASGELKRRGIGVPAKVAIAGFDDIEESRFITPPLSTVRQPLFEQGRQAVAMMVRIAAGEEIEQEIFLPTSTVLRNSCGCIDPAVIHAGLVHEKIESCNEPEQKLDKEYFLKISRQLFIDSAIKISGKSLDSLLESFWDECLSDSRNSFLTNLEQILTSQVREGTDLVVWQEAFSTMREQILLLINDRELAIRAEDLWQQARVMIGENAERAQAYRRFITKKQAVLLREIGQVLLTTFEMDRLLEVIYEQVPRAEIPGCYLVLYADKTNPPDEARLILGYNREGKVDTGPHGIPFSCQESLLPKEALPRDQRHSYMVLPLYFSYKDLGYVVIETGPKNGDIYDALRTQLSTAVEGAIILKELKEKQEEEVRRLKKEMEIAQRIQTALLPPIPSLSNYDIAAVMHPADDVGGDYYDFIAGSDGRHWFTIGDVSGHGLNSGLIMLMAQSAVSSVLKSDPAVDIKKLYSAVNALLFDNIRHRLVENDFMTLSIIALHNNHEFKLIGSHIKQLIYRASTKGYDYLEPEGIWAGLVPEVEHSIAEINFTLERGDILALFTDGLIEAMNKCNEQFENERVEEIIAAHCEKSAEEIKQRLLESVFNFMDCQADDITMVVIKRV